VLLDGAKEKIDAICVWLEHVDGDAVTILQPYHKGWTSKIKYDELVMTTAEHEVFRPPGGAA